MKPAICDDVAQAAQCDRFNRQLAVGDTIRFCTGPREGAAGEVASETPVRSPGGSCFGNGRRLTWASIS